MSDMRAKLRLQSVDRVAEGQETLRFVAVGPKEPYGADGLDENNTFAKFTPCADLTMQVLNPALLGKFEANQEFYVDFSISDAAGSSRNPDGTGKPAITRTEADAGLSAAPAPRVTLEAMEAKVASAEYFRSKTLTICILTLTNGFTIVGKSACASPENYNQALGERYAYDDAFRQIWAFEGYLLRERLAAA